jgi:hypothetical protein
MKKRGGGYFGLFNEPAKPAEKPLNEFSDETTTKKIDHLNRIIANLNQNNLTNVYSDVENVFGKTEHTSNIKKTMTAIETIFELDENQIKALMASGTDEKLKELLRAKPAKEFEEAVKGLNTGDVQKFLGDEVPDKLNKTMQSFVELNMKYRFYLYKYLQLNAFIPNFAQAVTSIHSDMYTSLLALTIYLHEKHKEVVLNIIKVFETATSSSDLKGLDKVESMMKELNITVTKDLAETFKNVIEKSSMVKTQTSRELMEWLVKEQTKMAAYVKSDGTTL